MGVFPSLFLAPMELSVKKVVERVQSAQPVRVENEMQKAKGKTQIVRVSSPSVP
jgi:metal-dependent HD superfamily phosphatase/phosphodiesterase